MERYKTIALTVLIVIFIHVPKSYSEVPIIWLEDSPVIYIHDLPKGHEFHFVGRLKQSTNEWYFQSDHYSNYHFVSYPLDIEVSIAECVGVICISELDGEMQGGGKANISDYKVIDKLKDMHGKSKLTEIRRICMEAINSNWMVLQQKAGVPKSEREKKRHSPYELHLFLSAWDHKKNYILLEGEALRYQKQRENAALETKFYVLFDNNFKKVEAFLVYKDIVVYE